MSDVCNHEFAVGIEEVVVFEIRREVDVGSRPFGGGHHGGSGSGAEGCAPNRRPRDAAVPYALEREPVAYSPQELLRRQHVFRFADDSESRTGHLRGGGFEKYNVPQPQKIAQHLAHALRGAVEVGVAGVERDAAAYGFGHRAFDVAAPGEAFQRMENDRVVGEDEARSHFGGFGNDTFGRIHANQGAVDFRFGVAHEEPRIVVTLLKEERGGLFQNGCYLFYFHCRFGLSE